MTNTKDEFLSVVKQIDKCKPPITESQTETVIKYLFPSINKKAEIMKKRYPSVDEDDLVSDGLLGLLKAIRYYDETKGTAFTTFANRCITTGMLNAVSRGIKSNSGLIKLEEYDFESSGTAESAEDALITKENTRIFMERLSEILSDMEFEVLKMYLEQYSYSTISKKLDCDEKAVDNAMQRAKSKIKKEFANNSRKRK